MNIQETQVAAQRLYGFSMQEPGEMDRRGDMLAMVEFTNHVANGQLGATLAELAHVPTHGKNKHLSPLESLMRDAHHGGMDVGYGENPSSGLTIEERAAWFSNMAQRKNEDETLGEQIALAVLADRAASPYVHTTDLRNAAVAVVGKHDVPVDREVKFGFIRELARSEGGMKPRQRVGVEPETATPEAAAMATVLQSMSGKDRAMALKQVPESERAYFQKLIDVPAEQLWPLASTSTIDEVDVGF